VLGLGFGGFLLWAALAPLDEGVPTQGMVTLDTKRKTVQHLTGGIVKEVLVQEGQQVKEGDPLLAWTAPWPNQITSQFVSAIWATGPCKAGCLLSKQGQASSTFTQM